MTNTNLTQRIAAALRYIDREFAPTDIVTGNMWIEAFACAYPVTRFDAGELACADSVRAQLSPEAWGELRESAERFHARNFTGAI